MNGKPNQLGPTRAPEEPAWLRAWLTKAAPYTVIHVETKGTKKRTRRKRRTKR